MRGYLRPSILAILTLSRTLSAESDSVRNWTAPPYWTAPAEAAGREALAAGRQPLTPGPVVMPFVAVAPCRVADTRGFGFTGAYGPPSLAASESRTYTIAGQCGIPADAQAVSFNFTVWNTASYGNLTVYPAGGAVPTVSTLNWPPGSLALANAAIVRLGTGGSAGQITVANQSGDTIDVFFDVNGYYSPLGVVNTVNGLSGNVSLASLPPSGAAGGALAGTYPSPTIAASSVGSAAIAPGTVVRSLNGLAENVTLAAGSRVTITPAGNTLTVASSYPTFNWIVFDFSLPANTYMNAPAVCPGTQLAISGLCGHRDYNSAQQDVYVNYTGRDPGGSNQTWTCRLTNTNPTNARAVRYGVLCVTP